MESYEAVLERQHGVLAWSTAVAAEGESAVRWRLRRGRWQRPVPAVIVTHSGPLSTEQRLWADLISAGEGAVLAGPTAARLDGLRGYETRATYILVPPGRQVIRRPDLVVHRSKFLGSEDVHPVRLPPRTRLARSLVDAAAWAATGERARSLLAAGIQQGLVRVDDLRAVLDRMPTIKRRGLVRRTLSEIAGGAHSLPELDFGCLLDRQRLPRPARQVVRRDGQGRRRWLDAYFERWNLVVEIDGRWHTEASAWWADMSRDNDLVIQGYRVLRFPAFAVRDHPEAVAAHIRTALRAAGWRG